MKSSRASMLGSVITLCGVIFLISCSEDEPELSYEPVNNWIFEQMEFWYYWNDSIQSNGNRNSYPEDFYGSLLISNDRFSWIHENYHELLESINGTSSEGGYEFILFRDNQSNVFAEVQYVKPNSPAKEVGLRRGDVITHINEKKLTLDTYEDLLDETKEKHTILHYPIRDDFNSFGSVIRKTIDVVTYTESPNFLDTIYHYNSEKIGYYVYNFFSNGAGGQHLSEMDEIFGRFKSEGITNLILDLRYNTGGSEEALINLASLVCKGIDSNTIFAKKHFNTNVTEIMQSSSSSSENANLMFINKANNVGGQLKNGRVYIIFSRQTASASEVLINCLNPFMDVLTISSSSERTYGKGVGSAFLYEENNPQNTWAILPVVTTIHNSLDSPIDEAGIEPRSSIWGAPIFLRPLGDSKEFLLDYTLRIILNSLGNTGSHKPAISENEFLTSSLAAKKGSFNLVLRKQK